MWAISLCKWLNNKQKAAHSLSHFCTFDYLCGVNNYLFNPLKTIKGMKKSLLLSLLLAFLCAFSVSAKKSNTIKCELILNDGKKVEGRLVKEKSASYDPYMV